MPPNRQFSGAANGIAGHYEVRFVASAANVLLGGLYSVTSSPFYCSLNHFSHHLLLLI
jgi:hypothetical protein